MDPGDDICGKLYNILGNSVAPYTSLTQMSFPKRLINLTHSAVATPFPNNAYNEFSLSSDFSATFY